MFIALKALGATCLAGALAASGVVTGDHLIGQSDNSDAIPAEVTADPHAILEALAVGEETEVSADEAGTLSIKRTETGLEVGAVTPADGWTAETRRLADDWLLVQFATEDGRKTDVSLDLAGENLRIRKAAFEVDAPTTTTTEPPTTTTTEPPTTTTTSPPPPVLPPVTLGGLSWPRFPELPPPLQPTVIPVAGAGSVVIVLQGPVIVVQKIKVVPGWIANVERNSGDVNVVFRNGGRSFRFLASMKDRRLQSDIRELRAEGDQRIGFDGHRDDGHGGKGHRGRH